MTTRSLFSTRSLFQRLSSIHRLARLLHANRTRPRQLLDTARSHQHARCLIATRWCGIQHELDRHDCTVSRQAITVGSFQVRRASLASSIAHLAPRLPQGCSRP